MENVVYHGSPYKDLEVLTPKESTHQKKCIYASPKRCVALLFMGKGNGDLDTDISSDNGKIILTERREGVLDNLYEKEGYLYVLDGSTFEHYDYLWSQEVISFARELRPIDKIYYPCILDALIDEEKEGHIIINRYPNRPENIPLDNSDLIEKYISYEKRGLIGAVDDLLRIYPEFSDRVRESKEKSR